MQDTIQAWADAAAPHWDLSVCSWGVGERLRDGQGMGGSIKVSGYKCPHPEGLQLNEQTESVKTVKTVVCCACIPLCVLWNFIWSIKRCVTLQSHSHTSRNITLHETCFFILSLLVIIRNVVDLQCANPNNAYNQLFLPHKNCPIDEFLVCKTSCLLLFVYKTTTKLQQFFLRGPDQMNQAGIFMYRFPNVCF